MILLLFRVHKITITFLSLLALKPIFSMKRFDFSSKNLQDLGNLKVLKIKETYVLDALLRCCSKESQAFCWRGSQMLERGANVKLSPTDLCVNCYSAKRLFQKKKKSRDRNNIYQWEKLSTNVRQAHVKYKPNKMPPHTLSKLQQIEITK